jgi:hypothetical protein
MSKAKANDDDEAKIIAMEDSWTFTEDGDVIPICGVFILRVLEKDKTSFKNVDGAVVSLPATHYKDGWAKMDMNRKKKMLKLWTGKFVTCVILISF